MRPIKLKIEGVKSFSNSVEIDFNKLLNAGMFGIFGDTGSGKSTILESIICSLYSSKFKTEYINKRCNYAEILFNFEIVIDGERCSYEVYRKFVKTGQSKAVLYQYLDKTNKISIAEKQRQVDDKLCEIIGLNCEEFETSIVLPQGKFDKFLTATRINRIKIMESLFSLQKYGENLKENIDKLNFKYRCQEADIKGKLSMLQDVDDNVLLELKNQLYESKKELDAVTIKNKKINDYIANYAQFYNGEKRLVEIENELASLNKKTPYYEDVKQNLSKLNDIKNYVQLNEQLSTLNAQLSALNSNLINAKESLKNYSKNEVEFFSAIDKLASEIEEKEKVKNVINVTVEKVKILNEQACKLSTNLLEIDAQIKTYNSSLQLELEESKNLTCKLEKIVNSQIDEGFDNEFLILEKTLSKKATLANIDNEKEFLNNLTNLVTQALALDAIADRLNYLTSVENELGGISGDYSTIISSLKNLLDKKLEIQNQTLKLQNEINLKNKDVLSLKEQMQTLQEKRKQVNEEVSSLRVQVETLTNGKNVLTEYENLGREILDLKNKKLAKEHAYKKACEEANNAKIFIASTEAKIDSLNTLLSTQNTMLNTLKLALNLDLENCRKIIQEFDKEGLKNEVENHFKNLLLLTEEKEKILKNQKNSDYDASLYQEYLQKKDEIGLNFINLTENFAKIKNNYEKSEQKYKDKCIIETDYNKLIKKVQLLHTLTTLVSSRKLLEFIADEYLNEISNDAKKTLFNLSSGKYGLVYDGEFYVTDNLNGGEKRQVSTLSGGETFIVSLSLALALSTVINHKSMRPIEFFFLDEGFGTLDKNLTETVISCLQKLKSQNLTIGLISHVDELKEAVDARIDVTSATLTLGSTVKITAN